MDTSRLVPFLLLLQSLFSVGFGQAWDIDTIAATNQLRSIERVALDQQLEMNPLQATQYDKNEYNDLLAVYTEKAQARQTRRASKLLRELETINSEDLGEEDQVNYRVLVQKLETFVNGSAFALYGSLTTMTRFENPLFAINMAKTKTLGDYENFIARLEAIPEQVSQIKQFCRKAISLGRTFHNNTMLPVISQLESYIVDGPNNSTHYYWFGAPLDESNVRSSAKRRDIRARGKAAISESIKAFRNLMNFLVKTYLPNTRTEYSVDSWGTDFYLACIKWHLTNDQSPEFLLVEAEVEVGRIFRRMRQAMRRLNFRGTPREFFEQLKGDPRFFVNDTAVVVQKYEEAVAMIRARINDIFEDAPDYPLMVLTSPSSGLAYYSSVGSDYGTSPGKLYIPIADLQKHPLYEVMSTSLGIVLGQHMQQSYVLRASLPEIRFQNFGQLLNVPYMIPDYNHHAAGWFLYAQYLGEELNLFADDYELMGWYASEIYQAARMVVDIGLHYYTWTREEAIAYMEENTAASMAEIEVDIDFIIAYPGRACAGTNTKWSLKSLLEQAKRIIGTETDVKGFNSVLLKHGLLPMGELLRQVSIWFEEHRPQ